LQKKVANKRCSLLVDFALTNTDLDGIHLKQVRSSWSFRLLIEKKEKNKQDMWGEQRSERKQKQRQLNHTSMLSIT